MVQKTRRTVDAVRRVLVDLRGKLRTRCFLLLLCLFGASRCTLDGLTACCGCFLFCACLKLLDTVGGIDNLLRSRKEGMAQVAQFCLNCLKRGSGLKGVAARTGDGGLFEVGWMNVRVHNGGQSLLR